MHMLGSLNTSAFIIVYFNGLDTFFMSFAHIYVRLSAIALQHAGAKHSRPSPKLEQNSSTHTLRHSTEVGQQHR